MKPSSPLRMTTPKMIAASIHRLEHQLGEAGTEQDVDQDVVELRQEAHERPPLLAFRQAVGAVFLQACAASAASRPFALSVARRFDLVGGDRMPSHNVGCEIGVRCCSHLRAPRSFGSGHATDLRAV